jgi:hypothetical protein
MSKRRTARQSDARPKKSQSVAMPAHDKAAQAWDDELTHALEDTFTGSDPVAMESPLVTGGPRKRD